MRPWGVFGMAGKMGFIDLQDRGIDFSHLFCEDFRDVPCQSAHIAVMLVE